MIDRQGSLDILSEAHWLNVQIVSKSAQSSSSSSVSSKGSKGKSSRGVNASNFLLEAQLNDNEVIGCSLNCFLLAMFICNGKTRNISIKPKGGVKCWQFVLRHISALIFSFATTGEVFGRVACILEKVVTFQVLEMKKNAYSNMPSKNAMDSKKREIMEYLYLIHGAFTFLQHWVSKYGFYLYDVQISDFQCFVRDMSNKMGLMKVLFDKINSRLHGHAALIVEPLISEMMASLEVLQKDCNKLSAKNFLRNTGLPLHSHYDTSHEEIIQKNLQNQKEEKEEGEGANVHVHVNQDKGATSILHRYINAELPHVACSSSPHTAVIDPHLIPAQESDSDDDGDSGSDSDDGMERMDGLHNLEIDVFGGGDALLEMEETDKAMRKIEKERVKEAKHAARQARRAAREEAELNENYIPLPSLESVESTLEDPQHVYIYNLDEAEVARQWTLVDHALFAAIPLVDFMTPTWDEARHMLSGSAIRACIDRFNASSLWVTHSVLRANTPKKRAMVYEWMVTLADQMLKIGNFATLTAIITGLKQGSVNRLQQTLALVSTDKKQELDALFVLMNGTKNYLAYRDKLRIFLPKMGENGEILGNGTPCVPHLGAHLSLLTTIDEGNREKLSNAPHLLNITKLEYINACISQLHALQQVHYKFISVRCIASAIDFILQNYILLRTSETSDMARALFSKSSELEPPGMQNRTGEGSDSEEEGQEYKDL
jgi:hypothetical protein